MYEDRRPWVPVFSVTNSLGRLAVLVPGKNVGRFCRGTNNRFAGRCPAIRASLLSEPQPKVRAAAVFARATVDFGEVSPDGLRCGSEGGSLRLVTTGIIDSVRYSFGGQLSISRGYESTGDVDEIPAFDFTEWLKTTVSGWDYVVMKLGN
ncbi:unnamed protein product [Fraxinus pennsylvanica]|uniref:Uncharacterized protein n=1 Tax=Fraxinus pennsylvanica TaxID=56036 RepID=A0AAD2A4A8_9LAMI|nr:unnamed protein product [Fraxinus pennsylvanica]